MKAFWALAILVLALTSRAAMADDGACMPKFSKFKLQSGATVIVGDYEAVAADAMMVFIGGPEKSFLKSQGLIKNFCRHGFSVVAFDVRNVPTPYNEQFRAGGLIATRIRQLRPQSPLVVYGWSKSAPAAVALARSKSFHFSKLILESPEITNRDAATLSRLPRQMTKIFVCPSDSKINFSAFRNIRGRASVYVPAHAGCGHQLTASVEAQAPLVDFIESDFAGIQAQNWYWSKKL